MEERPGPKREGLWAGFIVPPDVAATLDTKKADGTPRRRVLVQGSVNGLPYRTSLSLTPDGTYEMIVGRVLRVPGDIRVGDTLDVAMEDDGEPRVVEVPADLVAALDAREGMREAFERLSYSHQRELVLYVDDAKRADTRARRVQQVIDDYLGERG